VKVTTHNNVVQKLQGLLLLAEIKFITVELKSP